MSQYSHIPLWDAATAAAVPPDQFVKDEAAHIRGLITVGRIDAAVDALGAVPVYISDNRWVADCRVCNGGVSVLREAERGTCWDCGTSYPLEWPTDLTAAEEVLRERIPRLRNWTPGVESVEVLAEQNETLGLDHHSWTVPRTWVTSEVVTAALMNTHVRDNLVETAPSIVTTAEDIIVADGNNSLVRLAKGADNEYLRVISGTVQWST